ncbi:MAG: acetate--CoA ligase family protein, partial [Actinomycetota bacterium]|nr:acetate--CoA ligase family protein [Actinomycetota bacterium]
VVHVGLGGPLAETAAAAVTRLAPLERAEASEMASSVPGLAADPRGVEAVAAALDGLSRLAVEHPEVEAVDINPIIVAVERPLAVDALVAIGSGSRGGGQG